MQQAQRFTHRIAVGERAKVFAFGMLCATVHRQPRMGITAKENVGIRFIVAQQYVIARLIELDVVMLKQQRFGFGVGNGDIDVLDIADQRFGFAAADLGAEVAGETLLQVFGFAHIDDGA